MFGVPPETCAGYIAMLAVEKELRGKRIGSKLVQLCLDRMMSLGDMKTLGSTGAWDRDLQDGDGYNKSPDTAV